MQNFNCEWDYTATKNDFFFCFWSKICVMSDTHAHTRIGVASTIVPPGSASLGHPSTLGNRELRIKVGRMLKVPLFHLYCFIKESSTEA